MNNTAKLGLLLPAVLNPATAAVGIGLGLFWLFREDEDEDEASVELAKIKRLPPPKQTAVKRLATVERDVGEAKASEAMPAPVPDADQKEIIRSAMSELGKRSAAARAKRKAERQGQRL